MILVSILLLPLYSLRDDIGFTNKRYQRTNCENSDKGLEHERSEAFRLWSAQDA